MFVSKSYQALWNNKLQSFRKVQHCNRKRNGNPDTENNSTEKWEEIVMERFITQKQKLPKEMISQREETID